PHRPPEDVTGLNVGLAVGTVRARHGDPPVALDFFIRGQVAPLIRVVSLVPVLLYAYRLPILRPRPDPRRVGVATLQLDFAMGHPGLAVVIPDVPVVNSAQVVVRVQTLDGLKNGVPILGGREEVPLIRHRPPDISKSCQARDKISQVSIIMSGVHRGETPMVIRVEKNQIRLDAQGVQVTQALLNVPEILRIETLQVEFSAIRLPIGKQRRLNVIERIPFWKNAKPYLIKRTVFQLGKGFLL